MYWTSNFISGQILYGENRAAKMNFTAVSIVFPCNSFPALHKIELRSLFEKQWASPCLTNCFLILWCLYLMPCMFHLYLTLVTIFPYYVLFYKSLPHSIHIWKPLGYDAAGLQGPEVGNHFLVLKLSLPILPKNMFDKLAQLVSTGQLGPHLSYVLKGFYPFHFRLPPNSISRTYYFLASPLHYVSQCQNKSIIHPKETP